MNEEFILLPKEKPLLKVLLVNFLLKLGEILHFSKGKSEAQLQREKIAERACKEIKNGMYINLGIGIPTLICWGQNMPILIHILEIPNFLTIFFLCFRTEISDPLFSLQISRIPSDSVTIKKKKKSEFDRSQKIQIRKFSPNQKQTKINSKKPLSESFRAK